MNELKTDMDNLRHMLGADERYRKSQWGFRNHFCAGKSDIASMERLVAAGYVVNCGDKFGNTYYRATTAGCKVLGFGNAAIKRAECGDSK